MSMLVTLAKMKSYLGISDTSQDAFLTQQITVISDTIESYCRRVFASNGYVQTIYFNDLAEMIPSRELKLFHFPLTYVATVTIDDEVMDAADYRIHNSGMLVTADGSPWIDNMSEEIIVDYTAGFDAIPTPIENVVFSLVAERYAKKVSGVELNFGSDVQRLSIPGVMSIDFDYTLQSNERKSAFGMILGNWANVLDYYRSERSIIGSVRLEYVV